MKATRWIFVAALVPVIGLALANWLTAQKFRAENAALRAELQRQRDELAASTDAATSAASEQARELQRARADAAETLRLRGEVAQLRSGAQDAAKARGESPTSFREPTPADQHDSRRHRRAAPTRRGGE